MGMRSVLVIGLIVLFAGEAAAQNNSLRILCSNGLKAVFEELQSRAEREVGRPLSVEFTTSAAIRQRIQSGEAFDVAVLSSEVLDDMIKAGKIASSTRTSLGRSGIGIGVRSGVSKPDVASSEALKKTLLSAKSMTWVEVGASRVHIEKMLAQLGISKDVQPKVVLTQSVDQSVELVAGGKTELIITLISEIVPAKGLAFAGPLPEKLQNYIALAGGVSATSRNAEAGRTLLKLLSAPTAAAVYKSKGMELR